MSSLSWSEFSSYEVKDVDHAAFRACYQSETQSLLLLYNYVDFEKSEEYWEWKLIPGKKYSCPSEWHSYTDQQKTDPPIKWANKKLKQLVSQENPVTS